jgi:hypothetical protein
MASTTILNESEAEWAKDFATLARMSLSELLYRVLTLDGLPVQSARPQPASDQEMPPVS